MKLALIKTSSLGDIIHTFNVAAFLRKRFPEAQIDWIVEKPYAELVEANPHITNTLTIDTKQWRKGRQLSSFFEFRRKLRATTYDAVFDLQGNIKSGLVTYLTKSKQKIGFSKESVPEYPNLLFTTIRFNPPPNKNIREDYLSIVKQFYQDETPFIFEGVKLRVDEKDCIQAGHNDPVLVCPGSHWKNKQVSKEVLVEYLLTYQRQTNCHFYFGWGSLKERKFSEFLLSKVAPHGTLLKHLALPLLQNFMTQMRLVIAMDSLPLHLAGTTNTPTFSIFGPSSALKYAPQGNHHTFVQGACPYGKSFEKRCPILRTCKTGACIHSLKPNELIK